MTPFAQVITWSSPSPNVADQPLELGNEDGSVQVALNGAFYNFRELRAEVQARHTFRSQG